VVVLLVVGGGGGGGARPQPTHIFPQCKYEGLDYGVSTYVRREGKEDLRTESRLSIRSIIFSVVTAPDVIINDFYTKTVAGKDA
jgi:hypothetical protein